MTLHRGVMRAWRSPVALLVLVVSALRCSLPHGDDKLPSTDAPGVSRDAVLRVLIAPADRRVGATLPVTVEVDVANSVAPAAESVCIRLTADPGSITFPFGTECPGESAANAKTSNDGGAAGASATGARQCLTLRPSDTKLDSTAVAIAAYSPHDQEPVATVFGSLYRNTTCTGQEWVATAAVLRLTGEVSSDAGQSEGGTLDGGPLTDGGIAGSPIIDDGGNGGAAGTSSGGEGGHT